MLACVRSCAAFTLTSAERNAGGGNYDDMLDNLGRNSIADNDQQSNASVAARFATPHAPPAARIAAYTRGRDAPPQGSQTRRARIRQQPPGGGTYRMGPAGRKPIRKAETNS